ncbi:hypothetical protein HJG60_010973 [Phyllostomus discolor]|uniref:Uncharacterized protein n=1 Tax=Phyllostomus discolor TaxID=89673 RepID=A0A834ACG1_9CHIR|nr:hypothetical protein HJG60_010973 [Phyllostomus discolor]
MPGRQAPITSGYEKQWGLLRWKKLGFLGVCRPRTYVDSLPLGLSTGAAAGRAPVAYGEKLKCLASGQVPGDSFLSDKISEARQWHRPLPEPSSTQSHRAVTPYQRLHQPYSHRLPHLGDYLRFCSIQLTGALFHSRPYY